MNNDWDYTDADTNEFTHGIHSYPAKMVPQVARQLIDNYGVENGRLFDPFCGSGTTMLEAVMHGMDASGMELNPLAHLITRVKVTELNIDLLDKLIEQYNDATFMVDLENEKFDAPDFANIDFWFSPGTKKSLAFIKNWFATNSDFDNASRYSDFYNVAFSETVRSVSYAKKGEFKNIRMTPRQRAKFNPDVFTIMSGKLRRNRNAVASIAGKIHGKCGVSLSLNSAKHNISSFVDDESIDLMLTSPPYGDSSTTMAYGQFSKMSLLWMGHSGLNWDKLMLGGIRYPVKFQDDSYKFGLDVLDKAIYDVAEENGKRGAEIWSFYEDYGKSIKTISRTVKIGGFANIIVGNRTVCGIKMPTDDATVYFLEQCGFKHIETFERNIPHRVMPSANSPKNIAGQKGNMMKKEYIIICQKERNQMRNDEQA